MTSETRDAMHFMGAMLIAVGATSAGGLGIGIAASGFTLVALGYLRRS
jgi:hypothetical protein